MKHLSNFKTFTMNESRIYENQGKVFMVLYYCANEMVDELTAKDIPGAKGNPKETGSADTENVNNYAKITLDTEEDYCATMIIEVVADSQKQANQAVLNAYNKDCLPKQPVAVLR